MVRVLTKEEDADLQHQAKFMDGLEDRETEEVMDVLPFWQNFITHCEKAKQELSENLSHLVPITKTLIKKWKEYPIILLIIM